MRGGGGGGEGEEEGKSWSSPSNLTSGVEIEMINFSGNRVPLGLSFPRLAHGHVASLLWGCSSALYHGGMVVWLKPVHFMVI